jgi:hypothetical protein
MKKGHTPPICQHCGFNPEDGFFHRTASFETLPTSWQAYIKASLWTAERIANSINEKRVRDQRDAERYRLLRDSEVGSKAKDALYSPADMWDAALDAELERLAAWESQ